MESLLRIVSVICVAVTSVYSQTPVLDLYGESIEIQGVTSTRNVEGQDQDIHTYHGIPFAQPPIGKLRYQKPQPVTSMDSPFDATTAPPSCIQFTDVQMYRDYPQSEDCLYLNIYAPASPSSGVSGRAVAIWIHGGGYYLGSPNEYNAEYLALVGDVIIVTIAYRLGPYGFLSTEDGHAPGNYAFWDQHLAIQWVHDHIGAFGGDNERVTIFGESAGAMSAVHQGLIPKNRGLFQRVLAQSGSALTTIINENNALGEAQTLGSVLGCDTYDSYMLMDCLRDVSTEQLMEIMNKHGIKPDSFGYVIDNEIIYHDINLMAMSLDKEYFEEVEFYRSLDVLNGVNSHEGLDITTYLIGDPDSLLMSREDMKQLVRHYLGFLTGSEIEDSVVEMLAGEYTNWTSPHSPEEVRLQIIKLFGDYVFNAPAALTGQMHAMAGGFSGNYMYHFIANPSWSLVETPDWVQGASHGEEVHFMFGIEQFQHPMTKELEIKLSRQMMTYWTNFMKSGNPNMPTTGQPMWPQYDMETQSYLKFEEDTTDKSVGHFLYARETNFWFNVFPHINNAMERSGTSTDCSKTSDANMTKSSMMLSVVSAIFGLIMTL